MSRITTEKFLKMPPMSQLLYFHLKERAKDDVVKEPTKVMRMIGCTEEDLSVLVDNKYVEDKGGQVIIVSNKPKVNQEKERKIEMLFETLWKMYPNKKGKRLVSKAAKAELLKHDEEELKRAVERYAKEVSGREPRYIKHGSTFFNGDIYDYMDENYETMPKKFDMRNPKSYTEEDTEWL